MKVNKPWTKEDMDYLIANAGKLTAEYMGLRMGRTTRSVLTKASREKIALRSYAPWTREDVAFLEQNADKMTVKAIGEVLGRDDQSVRSKACNLGIALTSHRKYTKEDVQLWRELFLGGMPCKVIAEKFEVPPKTVRRYASAWRV